MPLMGDEAGKHSGSVVGYFGMGIARIGMSFIGVTFVTR